MARLRDGAAPAIQPHSMQAHNNHTFMCRVRVCRALPVVPLPSLSLGPRLLLPCPVASPPWTAPQFEPVAAPGVASPPSSVAASILLVCSSPCFACYLYPTVAFPKSCLPAASNSATEVSRVNSTGQIRTMTAVSGTRINSKMLKFHFWCPVHILWVL